MNISKKELLAETGISYGQLYRWKREGLIPEEWFSKQSSFTGQETFFERELIIPRIDTIMSLKETRSLDEIRRILGGEAESVYNTDDLLSAAKLDKALCASLKCAVGDNKLDISDIAAAAALKSGLGQERAAEIIDSEKGRPWSEADMCTSFEAESNGFAVFTKGTEPPKFCGGAKEIESTRLDMMSEKIKSNLKGDK